MKNNSQFGFAHLVVTYIIVKVVHHLAGFHYNPFQDGLLTYKLLVDILSWGMAGLIYFLSKRLWPQRISPFNHKLKTRKI
ncbi:hypothetical protein [Adhaeribacter radiodurans]|uniref:Uncharacterized protein n=1 Tax=Adhaeribacter radiodurans TaxID=2745197 RepID=A0A7L7L5T0_9BACT|nr:hypothetical protein [Adhaeribacter radiodurans]QMU28133.1 hypothetical protein HUW48_08785 [Adhaeribacter radiodurans]